jgi:ArsR family transcriptional regulator, cadmium/lead-responsive transcriptional repressor
MTAYERSTHPGLKAKLFRGFSDPSRLAILEALRAGPRTVTELVDSVGLSQSNTSNHLNCLLDCGLVDREQRGRFALYRLSDPRVELLLSTAGALLSEVAKGVHRCARYDEAGLPERAETA